MKAGFGVTRVDVITLGDVPLRGERALSRRGEGSAVGGGAACRSARGRSSLGGSMMTTHTVSIHPSSQGAEVERDHGQWPSWILRLPLR